MCEKCGDSGFILVYDEQGRSIARECACRQKMIAENRLRASGISEAFRRKNFENYDTRGNETLANAKAKAIDYVENFLAIEKTPQNSALFIGQVGAGKTHLSMAIANVLLDKYMVGVLYVPYRETMMELKQLAMSDKYKYDEKLHRLCNARLLVIDDLFKGSISDKDINYLFQIINYRYLNQLPFIVSSEKTKNELMDIDEAIATRLIEQARGHSVLFEGKKLNHRIY